MTFARESCFSLSSSHAIYLYLFGFRYIPICMKETSAQRIVFSKVENKNKKKNEEEEEENHACFDLKTHIMRAGCIRWLAVLI